MRLTSRTVEIFVKGERIAMHMRSSGNGKHTTAADHMPSSHRRYVDWTIGRIRRDAALIGSATAALCDLIDVVSQAADIGIFRTMTAFDEQQRCSSPSFGASSALLVPHLGVFDARLVGFDANALNGLVVASPSLTSRLPERSRGSSGLLSRHRRCRAA